MTVQTQPPATVAQDSFDLRAIVSQQPPLLVATACTFQVSTDAGFGASTQTFPAQPPCALFRNTSGFQMAGRARGLSAATTYFVRGIAQSASTGMTATGNSVTVTTAGAATGPPANVQATSFQATGRAVMPIPATASGATCMFELATDPGFPGSRTSVVSADQLCSPTAGAVTAITAPIQGLNPSSAYYYRAKVLLNDGTIYTGSAVKVVTASGPPPTPTPAANQVPPTPVAPVTAPPMPPLSGALSPTQCAKGSQSISAVGGSLEVTGCIYGDNEGHFVVEEPLVLNGLSVSGVGAPLTGEPSFTCKSGDAACNALAQTFQRSSTSALEIDVPDANLVSNGLVKVKAGDTTLYVGPLADPGSFSSLTKNRLPVSFDPQVAGEKKDSGPVISVGVNGSTQLFGFPLTGQLTIRPQGDGGAVLGVNVALPKILGGISGSTKVAISADGSLSLSNLHVEVGEIEILKLKLGNLLLDYDAATGTWIGETEATIPGAGAKLKVRVEVINNEFHMIFGQASGLSIVVPGSMGAATITDAGINFGINPLTFGGNLGVAAGPQICIPIAGCASAVRINAGFQIAVNSTQKLGPFADILPQQVTYTNVPFFLNVLGQLTVAGQIPLGSAAFNVLAGPNFTPLFTFAGGLGPLGGPGCQPFKPTNQGTCTPQGFEFKAAGVDLAGVKANLYAVLAGLHFNAEGLAAVKILGLGLSGKALLSTSGVAICAKLGSIGGEADIASAGGGASSGLTSLEPDALTPAPRASAAAVTPLPTGIRAIQAPSSPAQAAFAAQASRIESAARAVASEADSAAQAAGTQLAGDVAALRGEPAALAARVISQFRANAIDTPQAGDDLIRSASAVDDAAQALEVQASQRLQAIQAAALDRLTQLQTELDRAVAAAQTAMTGSVGRAVVANIFDDAWNGIKDIAGKAGDFISSAAKTVGGALSSAFKKVTGAAADAAVSVATELAKAASAVGDKLDKVGQQIQQGLGTLAQTLGKLGKDAVGGLKTFANAVASGAVLVARTLSNLLNGEIGVGYRWGGKATFYPTGGCDVGSYVDRVNLPAGKAREAGATESVSLRSGPAFALLKLVGQGGPPTVSVRGPAGLRLVTPAGGQAQMEDRGAAFALADPTSDTTFVELKPHTGRYTIAVRPGSAPLRSISSSYSLPEPQVTATVSGHGIDRTLTWHATGISGQSLTFTELGANGSQVIARTTSASGTIPFRALPALPGPRTVQVTVEEHGMTRTTQDVATFAGPTMPAPATPADLVVRRSDSSLYVSWRGSGAVDHYHVLVNTTGGTMTALDSSATAIAVPNVLDSDAVSVEVTAIDGVGTQSDAASRTLDGNGVGDCSSTRAFKLELQLPPGERLSRGVVKLGDVVVAELSDGQTAVPVELSDQPRRGEALSAVATTAGGTELAGSIAVTDCDVATTDGVRVLTLKPVS